MQESAYSFGSGVLEQAVSQKVLHTSALAIAYDGIGRWPAGRHFPDSLIYLTIEGLPGFVCNVDPLPLITDTQNWIPGSEFRIGKIIFHMIFSRFAVLIAVGTQEKPVAVADKHDFVLAQKQQ